MAWPRLYILARVPFISTNIYTVYMYYILLYIVYIYLVLQLYPPLLESLFFIACQWITSVKQGAKTHLKFIGAISHSVNNHWEKKMFSIYFSDSRLLYRGRNSLCLPLLAKSLFKKSVLFEFNLCENLGSSLYIYFQFILLFLGYCYVDKTN